MVTQTERIAELENTIKKLWKIIDDIDTAGDIAKGDNVVYRKLVQAHQKKRWETGITTDGYVLNLENLK